MALIHYKCRFDFDLDLVLNRVNDLISETVPLKFRIIETEIRQIIAPPE